MESIPEEGHNDDVVMGPPPLPRPSSERRVLKAKRKTSYTRDNNESHENTTPKRPSPDGSGDAGSSHPLIVQSKNDAAKNVEMYPREAESTENRRVVIYFNKLEVVRTLGEGAFGEVVLMVDRDDATIAVAVKRINYKKLTSEQRSCLKKEALVQRAVRGHHNVLKYLNMQAKGDFFELYLEYADGGELFDQIEPDYGMEPPKAQYYFRQLLTGVNYLHENGVVHRDLKPENLLITKRHVLKICDFGMATVFKTNGKERLLNTRCGTMPYAAPEVFTQQQYRGEPVDIWSSGIVLITMLVGELPWEKPTIDSEPFVAFMEKNDLTRRPWSRFDTKELSLIRMMLILNPQRRGSLSRIMKHPWFTCDLSHQSSFKRKIPSGSSPIVKRVHSNQGTVSSSQPSKMLFMGSYDSQYITMAKLTRPACPVSFSQPTNMDNMLLNKSQLSASQVTGFAHPHATLVRRMTRFCVTVDAEAALEAVQCAANNLHCQSHSSTNHQVYITCLATNDLSFVATVYEMIDEGHQKVLIDFRRSRGDGLDFKRRFLEFKEALSPIISRDSLDWLEKKGLVCTRKIDAIIAESNPTTTPIEPSNETLSIGTESTRRHTDTEA